jgi:multidrug efflux pump subunit AcrB
MWIVRLALRRPYTFVVASMLVVLLGIYAITSMATDVFPVVDIPVIAVCYNYTGMSPADMNARIITPFERILGTTVNDCTASASSRSTSSPARTSSTPTPR